MAVDVSDLRAFYSSPLGEVARRYIGRTILERWENCVGLSLMGLGYAPPYFAPFRERAMRVVAFMPAEQGVTNWPTSGAIASALVDPILLPLPDASIDRALLVHMLEMSDQPRLLLEEIWRVLAPGGRMILVVPNRGGVWARFDRTPFGHGLPYSRSQLRELLRETDFLPIHWAEALYAPPFMRPFLLRTSAAFETMGSRLALPGSGVHLVEATKQLYRPIAVRRSMRRALPQFAPAPAVGRAGLNGGPVCTAC